MWSQAEPACGSRAYPLPRPRGSKVGARDGSACGRLRDRRDRRDRGWRVSPHVCWARASANYHMWTKICAGWRWAKIAHAGETDGGRMVSLSLSHPPPPSTHTLPPYFHTRRLALGGEPEWPSAVLARYKERYALSSATKATILARHKSDPACWPEQRRNGQFLTHLEVARPDSHSLHACRSISESHLILICMLQKVPLAATIR